MAKGASYIVGYRRKREGKTNYKKRLNLLKSGILRLVVRKSNKNVTVQLIEYNEDGDKIISQASSKQLSKYGWTNSNSNLPAAYLTGLLCGITAKGEKAILDTGLHNPIAGSKMYAALKGAVDAGVEISFDENVLPSQERIKGAHIQGKDVEGEFETVKNKIMTGNN